MLNPTTDRSLSVYASLAKSHDQIGVAPSCAHAYGGQLNSTSHAQSSPQPAMFHDTTANSAAFATTLPVTAFVAVVVACAAALGLVLGGGWFLWTEHLARQRRRRSDPEGQTRRLMVAEPRKGLNHAGGLSGGDAKWDDGADLTDKAARCDVAGDQVTVSGARE